MAPGRWWMHAIVASVLVLALSGCVPESFSKTQFQREAGDATSLLSAAAMTIEFAHTGKLDDRYAQSSIAQYRDLLVKIPDPATLDGSPDTDIVGTLQEQLDASRELLADPCLDDDCDWQAQVDALRQASQAFEEAGG